MKGSLRAAAGVTLAILVAGSALAARPPVHRGEFDAFGSDRRLAARPERVAPAPGQVREGTRVLVEERLAVPTFLWAGDRGMIAALGLGRAPRGQGEVAREHLRAYAPLYRLDPGDVDQVKVRGVHDTGRGAVIVSFYQEVDGIEVFRDEIKLALNRNNDLVAIAGYLTRTDRRSRVFRIGAAEAVAEALGDLTDYGFTRRDLLPIARRDIDGPYERFILDPRVEVDAGFSAPDPLRARRVWFRLADGLEPAWQTEVAIGAPGSVETLRYGHVVSAVDGSILLRHDFTVADSFSYRVWADPNDRIPFDGPQGTAPTPHPTGAPDGFQPTLLTPPLITLQAGPISTLDPWLPPGATSTVGNNVDAYADLAAPDGFSAGDLRATTTSPGVFDRTYNTTLNPDVSTTQRQAAIAQLFYTTNWLHDWFYDSGFDEASGNAQTDNYGRGGDANDALHAQAQDYSGRNNANMSTPPDGFTPRMQMYIFDGAGTKSVQVNTPASIAGSYSAGSANFGPQGFNLTDDVVLVNDPGGVPSDGCETPFNNQASVNGKIALVDRGTCSFLTKAQNAQAQGAVGLLVANNQPGLTDMSGTGSVSIPSLLISQADGNTFKSHLASLNVTLMRAPSVDRDGTIDNQIVAHEWGHYISNRLVGNAFGLTTIQSAGLGEGWGDFHAQLMAVRPEDANAPTGADFAGAYAVASYALSAPGNQAYYFGIRRAPLSTDPNINPLTFQHIENGVPLPTGAPLAFGQAGASNAEVHNTGEIWANMLWECYASMLRDTLGPMPRLTFAEAQQRMKDYLVAGYKMTPNAPTLLEARDAVLAAAYANDTADFEGCWAAFAKRGAGVGAVAPDRFDTNNAGVVESYATGGALLVASIALTDDVSTACLPDGAVDNGETGTLRVMLENRGSTTLSAATATVGAANPNVSFPSGTMASFPPVGPFGTGVAELPVTVSGASGIEIGDFTVSIDEPSLVVPGPVVSVGSFRINADEIPAVSATDDVESVTPVWSVDSDPVLNTPLPFERIEISGLDHRWLGPDTGASSDSYLVSPPLNVASSGNLVITFDHRFDFETSGGVFYDGGVLEISDDGGVTWYDIGWLIVSGGYNGILELGGSNPLEGRNAFAGRNGAYPNLTTVSLDLGTAYQGMTVQVRFRIGTDLFVGAPGWEIDNLTFGGITNTPFAIQVPHDPTCDADSDMVVDAADCSPSDPSIWGAPTPILDLTAEPLATPGSVRFTFTPPGDAGGVAGPTYDAVVAGAANGFGAGACAESNDGDLEVITTSLPPPGGVEYLLVGARSACGRTFAPDSRGVPRNVVSCVP